ncbi:MAG: hypothetical protein AAFR73_05385 [Pseudomonadota bacterium]
MADAHAPAQAPVSVLPDWKKDVAAKVSVPFALLLGIVVIFFVRLAQFHINGNALITSAPDKTMAIEAGVALLLSVIVMLMMPTTSALAKLGYLVGLGIGLVFMHNAVHSMPTVFSLAFSSEWTESVVAMTEPSSVLFRGESIPIVLPTTGEEENVKPTVLRLN